MNEKKRHVVFLCVLSFLSFGSAAKLDGKTYINRQNVSCMLLDGKILWIGTKDAGLIYRNTETNEETIFDKDNNFFSDQVIDIVKDSNNTLWVASSAQLASYSNNNWKQYGLFDTKINDIEVDVTGSVWVACSNGIGKQKNGQFEKISAFDKVKASDEYPTEISSGNMDSCVYVRANKRIFKFDIKGTCLEAIVITISNPIDFIVDAGNRIFIAGVDSLALYSDGKWKIFTTGDSSLSSGVLKLSRSSQGDIWAYGQNVMVFNNEKWEVKYRYVYGEPRITFITPVNSDSAWVGGYFFLAYLTPDRLKVIPSNTPGTNDISFVYADKAGTIWAQAVSDRGIVRFVNENWEYNALFNSLYNKCRKMICTSEGVYWFLLPNNICYYKNKINGTVVQNVTGSGFVPSGTLNDLAEDYSGKIWFATSNGVIENWGNILFNKASASFPSNNIKTLLSRKDSSLWIGGDSSTLAYYKDSTWTLETLPVRCNVNCLAEDSSGDLWIGTSNGVINKARNKDVVYNVSDGLGHTTINALCIDYDNRIWAGTSNGLSYFENNTWTTLRRPDRISGDYISSITQNNDSTLWIGTDRGICTLKINSTRIKMKGYSDKVINANARKCTLIHLKGKNVFQKKDHLYLINGKCRIRSDEKKNKPVSNFLLVK